MSVSGSLRLLLAKGLSFLVVAVVVAILVFPQPIVAQADPLVVIQSYLDALNRGDAAGALAVFTDDAVYSARAAGVCVQAPCVGKSAIGKQMEFIVSIHAHFPSIASQNPVVSGSTVIARAEVRGDPIRAAGVERIINKVTYEIRGDQIASLRSQPDVSDPQTATFVAYQQAHAPAQLPKAGEPVMALPVVVSAGVLALAVGLMLRRRIRPA